MFFHIIENGAWSDWNAYGDCSSTCGIGHKTRSRKCSGSDCVGKSSETKTCENTDCTGRNV